MGLLLLLHLGAAVIWVGGMSFVLLVLRPALLASFDPPQRARLLLACLRRFLALVWACVAVLLGSGVAFMQQAGWGAAPLAWQAMMGLGLAMMVVFAYLALGPWRSAQAAAAQQEWSGVAAALTRIHRIVQVNFTLGWLALAAITLLR